MPGSGSAYSSLRRVPHAARGGFGFSALAGARCSPSLLGGDGAPASRPRPQIVTDARQPVCSARPPSDPVPGRSGGRGSTGPAATGGRREGSHLPRRPAAVYCGPTKGVCACLGRITSGTPRHARLSSDHTQSRAVAACAWEPGRRSVAGTGASELGEGWGPLAVLRALRRAAHLPGLTPPPPSCSALAPNHSFRPEIGQDHPLNLSISISGGKENNSDALSNGERTGHSPAPNPRPSRSRGMWR